MARAKKPRTWPGSPITGTLLDYAEKDLKAAHNRYNVTLREAASHDGVPDGVSATFKDDVWTENEES